MLKNILANCSNIIFSIMAVFVLYPFCIKTLGDEQYSVWLLISSAIGYFYLLQLGVPPANVRFISQYHAQQDYDKTNSVISTNILIFSIIAFIILVLGTGLAFVLEKVFKIRNELINMTRIATIIATIDVSSKFLFEVFEDIFHAMQNFVVFNFIKNVVVVIRVLAIILLLRYHNGIVILASILLLVTSIQSLCFCVYIHVKYKFLKIRIKYITTVIVTEIMGYSIYMLLFNVASRISFETDALVIGSVVSVSAITWFNIASNLLIYLMQMVAGISNAIMPKISELDAIGLVNNIRNSYSNYSRQMMLFLLPICLSFWLYGGDFISLWVGEQYREVSGTTLSILTLGYLLFLVQSGVAFPILMGTSRMKLPTLFMCSGGLANLGLSIFWGRTYGIYGVAWGTTLPTIVFTGLVVVYMCRTLSIPFHQYCYNSLLYPALAAIPYLIVYLCLFQLVRIDSYLKLFLCFTTCAISYCLGIYYWFLSNEHKTILFSFILRKSV